MDIRYSLKSKSGSDLNFINIIYNPSKPPGFLGFIEQIKIDYATT